MKIDDVKFAKLVGKFLNVPYKLGGQDFNGMDCVSFIYLFYKMYGVDIPDEFSGFTMQNYVEEYNKSGKEGKKIFADYIRSWTKEANKSSKGDIIILFVEDDLNFAIDIGRGNILVNDYRIGNIVCPLNVLEYDKIEIREVK